MNIILFPTSGRKFYYFTTKYAFYVDFLVGSKPGLLYCRWVLYHLNHQGSPRILEWIAIPSPADLPNPGIEPGSPELQANSLPTELSGKPLKR